MDCVGTATDHIYIPDSFVSTGFLLFDSGPDAVTISRNLVARNDIGLYGIVAGARIDRNAVRDSDFDGILLCGLLACGGPATGNVVSDDLVRDNATNPGVFDSAGMSLYDADDNAVSDDPVLENGVAPNGSHTDGIFLDADSTMNVIDGNFLRDNVAHDCHDATLLPPPPTPPALNTWTDNDGETQNRLGLCNDDGDDDDDDDDDDDQATKILGSGDRTPELTDAWTTR